MNESKIEVLEPEVVKKEVALVATKTGMEQSAALVIKEKFKPYYMEIIKWRSQAAGIGDPADPDQQKKAREVRLALRKARCDVENTRKQEKDGYLKAGQFIDGIARILKQECEPIEAKLEDVEKYAERIEAERKAKLAEARTKQLLDVDPECDPLTALPVSSSRNASQSRQNWKTWRNTPSVSRPNARKPRNGSESARRTNG